MWLQYPESINKSAIFIRRVLFTAALFFSSLSHSATILVHGDSLSAGYGFNPEFGWVELLNQQYGQNHTFVNSSISGETSRGGKERLPALLETHTPDVLIIELGANDGLRGYDIAQMRQHLEDMIEMGQTSGAKVILAGIQLPPNYGKRYTQPFFESFSLLSQQWETGLIPFLLENVATKSELMQNDGLHPTQEAQPIIANTVDEILKPLLEEI